MATPTDHTVTLALGREELRALHHALLERLDAERTAPDPAAVDPPPFAVSRVFETHETGDTRVRVADLEAVTGMVDHEDRCPPWCLDCDRLRSLHTRLERLCERQHAPRSERPADDCGRTRLAQRRNEDDSSGTTSAARVGLLGGVRAADDIV